MSKASVEIRSLARSHTETCIRTLAGIVRQKTAPPAARVAAASELLDRGWGKPEQRQSGSIEHLHYVARLPAILDSIDKWQENCAPLGLIPLQSPNQQ